MLYDKAPKIVFAVEHVQFRGRRVLWAIPTPRASVVLDLFICWPVQSNLETKRSKKSREGLKKDPEQLEANHKKDRERKKKQYHERMGTCTIADAKEDLISQFKPFGRHVYNIRWQFKELRHLKDSLEQWRRSSMQGFQKISRLNIK